MGENSLRCMPGLLYPFHFQWNIIKSYPSNQAQYFFIHSYRSRRRQKKKRETSGRGGGFILKNVIKLRVICALFSSSGAQIEFTSNLLKNLYC